MMIRAGNNLIDPEKVSAIVQHETDNSKVVVILDCGRGILMSGTEAAEIWRHFDKENDWQKPNDSVK